LVQAFLKKWWVESDFKAPHLLLSLRLKVSGCHYNSIYNNTCTKQVKQLSNQRQMSKTLLRHTLNGEIQHWWLRVRRTQVISKIIIVVKTMLQSGSLFFIAYSILIHVTYFILDLNVPDECYSRNRRAN
jgi:hypothetical protein